MCRQNKIKKNSKIKIEKMILDITSIRRIGHGIICIKVNKYCIP